MFPIKPGRDYAVITGDVIDSSSLAASDRKRLPGLIHQISETLVGWYGDAKLTPLSIFGGDSWRVLIASPGDALRVGLFVRASLLASGLNIDTRMAIAVGGVDFVPDGDIEQADGEAFRLSGRLLGEDSKSFGEIRFASVGKAQKAGWPLTIRLLDAIIRSTWTDKRALAMCGALQGWTRQRTSELWTPPVSRQTVDRHLQEACWPEVEAILSEFEGSRS